MKTGLSAASRPPTAAGGNRRPLIVILSALFLINASLSSPPAARALARTARPGHFTVAAVKEAGERGGALSPTTEDPARFTPAGNEAFGACMTLWNAHRWDEACAAMLAFSAANPADPWRGESDLHVACYHKFRGEYTEAEAILARLIEENRDNPVGRKALVRLARVYLDTRRYAAARSALRELLSLNPTENEKTYALNWLPHVNRAEQYALAARDCGPKAFGFAAYLSTAKPVENRSPGIPGNPRADIPALPCVSFAQVAEDFPWAAEKGDSNGVTVARMRTLLAANGWSAEPRRLTYAEAVALASETSPVVLCVPAPSAPLLKFFGKAPDRRSPTADPIGHYTVLVKADAAIAWLVDPENGLVQKDARALRDDWLRGSERGLACLLSNGGRTKTERHEGAEPSADDDAFAGGCCGHETNNDDTGIADDTPDGCGNRRVRSRGMPVHSVHTLNLNYMLTDTPLWCDTPAGPPLELTLTYNNRESYNAKYPVDNVQFYPLGCRWSAPYDSAYALDPGGHVLVRLPTGREIYFNLQTDGSFLPRDTRVVGQYDLAPLANGEYRLDIDRGLTRYFYRSASSVSNLLAQTLRRIEDNFGNAINISRDPDTGLFQSVSSEVTGFSFTYTYNPDGTVASVALLDPSGNGTGSEALFSYVPGTDGHPDLASITDMGGQKTEFGCGPQTNALHDGIVNNDALITTAHHVTAMTWPNGDPWRFDLHPKYYMSYAEPLELVVTDPSRHETVYLDYAYASEIGLVGRRDRNGAASVLLSEKSGTDGPVLGNFATLVNDRWENESNRKGEVADYRQYAVVSARREVMLERTLLAPSTAAAGSNTSMNNELNTKYAHRRETRYAYADLSSGGRRITASNFVFAANNITPVETWTETAVLDANEDPVRVTGRDGSSLLFTRTNRLVTAVRFVPSGVSATQTLWQAGYNALGQPLWHTADEGLSNALHYAYDQRHRPDVVTMSNVQVAAFGYEGDETLPSSVTDADGNVTTFERDALDRPTLILHPDGSAEQYAYNCCQPSVHIDRHGVTNTFTYDGNKRPESAVLPFDAAASTHLAYTYLGEGELSSLGVGPSPQDLATRSFLYAVTNGITRLSSRKDAIGRTRETFAHTFDGLASSRVDGCGNRTTNVWDTSHTRISATATTGSAGVSPALGNAVTSNRYDYARDLLTNTVRHANVDGASSPVFTNSASYFYDYRKRPSGQTVILTGLPGQTAPLTYTLAWAYGPRGFVTNRTLTVGGTVIPESYTYHPFLPLLASVSNPHASVTYTHIDSGRLLAKSTPATTEYRAYDDLALPFSTVISNAISQLRVETYAWDVDRLASVATMNTLGSRLTVYGYNYQSMVTAATTYTNNAPAFLERFDYKATGSMTARTFTPYTNALAAPNAVLTANRADELTRHTRNGVATITGTTDPAVTVKYYPTAAQQPRPAEQDAQGNWVAPNVPMYPMSNGLVRIQFKVEKEGQAPSFQMSEFSVNKVTTPIGNDANGSLTNLPSGDTLAYDCENNLHCVSNTISGGVAFCYYDQSGRRIAKTENNLLTLYIWDGMDIIATANADGTIREYFTRGIGIAGDVGSLVAETRFEGSSASTVYLHNSWRGDVVMATDESGAVVGEYGYATFGEMFVCTGSYLPRFTFSSKERDASGLFYFGFRYYSPGLCRWISEDPQGEAGGINLYQFCGNNPVNGVDPWGLQRKGGYELLRQSHAPYLEGGGGGGSISIPRPFTPLTRNPPAVNQSSVPRITPPSSQPQPTTVIGRVKDLQNLGPCERSLLNRLPDLGNPQANWKQNSGVLRQEIRRGVPIRDASPLDNTSGTFLNAERNVLQNFGWSIDPSSGLWRPPL